MASLVKNAARKLRVDVGGDGGSVPASETRRLQLRLAQRRRRNRKEAYEDALRKEAAELRRLCQAVRQENYNLRQYLKQQLGMDRGSMDNIAGAFSDPNSLCASSPETDPLSVTPTHSVRRITTESGMPFQLTTIPASLPDDADDELGINWILGLERVCLDHIHLVADPDGSHSHQMSSQLINASSFDITKNEPATFEAREASLSTLLRLSKAFALDEEEITPVQAWFMLKNWRPSSIVEAEKLESLLKAVLLSVKCYGFGAVIDKTTFHNSAVTIIGPPEAVQLLSNGTQQKGLF